MNGSEPGGAKAGVSMQVTLGNIISWLVMVATMGIVYGTLSQDVHQNARINDRQEDTLSLLTGTFNDLRVRQAETNVELKNIREILERAERVERRAQSYRPSGTGSE